MGKITAKDIHSSFWKCRDFELSHLWQRSIFLTTFLVLSFTGYGCVTTKLFDLYLNNSLPLYLEVVNMSSFGLSIIGIMLSILWILMGKGSKAWFERYENAISAMETNPTYAEEDIVPIAGFSYENIEGYEKPEVVNCILSSKGGAYSPSKINIVIGQIVMFIWIVLAVVHLILLYKLSCLCFWGTLCLGGMIIAVFGKLIMNTRWVASRTINQ